VFTITLNGQSAVVSIGNDGTATLSDPNHLFNPLKAGDALVLQSHYTVSDSNGGVCRRCDERHCQRRERRPDRQQRHLEDTSISTVTAAMRRGQAIER
jgi:hypothetical protein